MKDRFKHQLHLYWPVYIATIISISIIFTIIVLHKSTTNISVQIGLAFIPLLAVYISSIQIRISNDNIYKDLSISFNKRFEEIDEKMSLLKIELDNDFSKMKVNEKYQSYGKRYFDLCSDQYHWHKKNRIDPNTWNIWLSSMNDYIDTYDLHQLKEIESKKDKLYYGLFAELNKHKREKK